MSWWILIWHTAAAVIFETIHADNGTLNSTNYPSSYPQDISSGYLIVLQNDGYIVLTFHDLYLGSDEGCHKDSLQVT